MDLTKLKGLRVHQHLILRLVKTILNLDLPKENEILPSFWKRQENLKIEKRTRKMTGNLKHRHSDYPDSHLLDFPKIRFLRAVSTD